MTPTPITVEMLDGGHPLIRFPCAFATRKNAHGELEQIFGAVTVSLETMEEAITLRDSLSAFIAFHQGCEKHAAENGD